MINKLVSSFKWELFVLFLILALLLSSCVGAKKTAATEKNSWLVVLVKGGLSVEQMKTTTFYTDSVDIVLRRGSNLKFVLPKTECRFDTVAAGGKAIFEGGQFLYYEPNKESARYELTTLYDHPDSVMIKTFNRYTPKEIWALENGKGTGLFYDPSTVKELKITATEVSGFTTDTIKGYGYTKKLVKPKKN